MNITKIIIFLFMSSLLLSSCSKKENQNYPFVSKRVVNKRDINSNDSNAKDATVTDQSGKDASAPDVSATDQNTTDQNAKDAINEPTTKTSMEDPSRLYLLWEQLIIKTQGNLAFSEVLAKSVYHDNKNYIVKNIKPLSLDEVEAVVKQIERSSNAIKTDLIYYDSKYRNDQDFYAKTILNAGTGPNSLENQFLVNTFAKVKSDLLKNILTIYDQRIKENSNEIAEFLLKEINDNNPTLKDKIEKTLKGNPSTLRDTIAKSLGSLKTLDRLFKNSELNSEEQLSTIAIGIVSEQIYNKLKDKKTFQEILKDYVIVKDVTTKAYEISALLAGINNYQKEMVQDWDEFGKALKGLSNDSSRLVNSIPNYNPQLSNSKIQKFLYEAIFQGRSRNNDEINPSVLSTQVSLNKNFSTAIDKAQKLNNNLYVILNSTQKIAGLLKIELPGGVKKVMETAEKANVIFTTFNTAILGLKTGGIIGALSALSAGPAMGLLGLNSDPNAEFRGEVLAQFGVVNQKLDDILELQKQTIKIQLETMSMIKNMAVMIDENHRQEMNLLSDVRDISLSNLEMSKVALNGNIKACERLLNFQLNLNSDLSMYKFTAFENMKALDLDIQNMKKSLNTYDDILKMINSTEARGWENCQQGLNEAFGGIDVKENPIRSIYSSGESENLFKFQREKYKPLYEVLSIKNSSVLYHLPVSKFFTLLEKDIYLKNEKPAVNSIMEDFISVSALERYTSQLLVFYPFLDLDKDDWKNGLGNILELALKNTNSGKNSRAYYLLRNNLSLIQTAIAEQSLISGELIFDELENKKNVIFQDVITSDSSLSYAVVTNRLLMKNFLKYIVLKNMLINSNKFTLQIYSDLFSKNKLNEIGLFFNNYTIQKNLMMDKNDKIILRLKVDNNYQFYQIPTPAELENDLISYPENMYRLLELQKRVIDALVKISPDNFSDSEKWQLARGLIFL